MVTTDSSFVTGKKPQHRNGKLKPDSKNYDPIVADRRKKEKARRVAEKQRRKIDGR